MLSIIWLFDYLIIWLFDYLIIWLFKIDHGQIFWKDGQTEWHSSFLQ